MDSSLLRNLAGWLGRHPHLLLASHLLVLHALAFGGWQTPAVRLLWLVAVGFLLLWQPFFEGERRITRGQGLIMAGVILGFLLLLNPWLLLIWSGALAAVIGGRVFWTVRRAERTGYLYAFGYLVGLIVLGIVPEIAPDAVALDPLSRDTLALALPVLLPVLLLFPARQPLRRVGESFDFFYGVLVFLLLAVFVLGSLAYMLIGRVSYLDSVFRTSMTLAGALLLLAWTWNPRAGFSGIGSAFARYLLSVGMPLEQWLVILNEESEREQDAERFLDAAVGRLLRLPWVVGGRWRTQEKSGGCGVSTGHEHDYERGGVRVGLFFRHAPSPAMRWHVDWLLRLAAEFYVVKRQTRELQQISYLQAVYQTGARVTHDVKNLLQSLQVLCYAAAQPGEPAAVAQLLGRQLPLITERLKATLEKLQRPQTGADDWVAAQAWWEGFRQRHAEGGVSWALDNFPATVLVPRELFDSVAENLLQNALAKRQREPGITIEVALLARASQVALRVEDGGAAIAEPVASRLFAEPVGSEDGLGIGLYHAARQAESLGYGIALESNVPGRVAFSLTSC